MPLNEAFQTRYDPVQIPSALSAVKFENLEQVIVQIGNFQYGHMSVAAEQFCSNVVSNKNASLFQEILFAALAFKQITAEIEKPPVEGWGSGEFASASGVWESINDILDNCKQSLRERNFESSEIEEIVNIRIRELSGEEYLDVDVISEKPWVKELIAKNKIAMTPEVIQEFLNKIRENISYYLFGKFVSFLFTDSRAATSQHFSAQKHMMQKIEERHRSYISLIGEYLYGPPLVGMYVKTAGDTSKKISIETGAMYKACRPELFENVSPNFLVFVHLLARAVSEFRPSGSPLGSPMMSPRFSRSAVFSFADLQDPFIADLDKALSENHDENSMKTDLLTLFQGKTFEGSLKECFRNWKIVDKDGNLYPVFQEALGLTSAPVLTLQAR